MMNRLLDTEFCLCSRCAVNCVDASILGEESPSPFQCSCSAACQFGLGLSSTCCVFPSTINGYPLILYMKRKLFDNIKNVLSSTNASLEREILQRLQHGCQQLLLYETPSVVAAARRVIDYRTIITYADEYAATHNSSDVCLMHGLMKWFKRDYFKWCDRPSCSNIECGAKPSRMEGAGVVAASVEEQQGWASRTELYQCKDCGTISRYPRYNHPIATLLSQRGRCGEFANAFCLVCRALGIDARWVLDFTDHVWVEVYLPSMGQYVHADPCERKLDKPLVYEKGWKKKLSYVISFSRCGVEDVTSRYTSNIVDVYSRRGMSSSQFCSLIESYDSQQQQRYANDQSSSHGPLNSDVWNFQELFLCGASTAPLDCDLNTLLRRKTQDRRRLKRFLFRPEVAASHGESEGRITGDEAWKRSRGEQGDGSSASKTANVRQVSDDLPFVQPGCILSAEHVNICIYAMSAGTVRELYASPDAIVTLAGVPVISGRSCGASAIVVCCITGALLHCYFYDDTAKAIEELVPYANTNTIVVYVQHNSSAAMQEVQDICKRVSLEVSWCSVRHGNSVCVFVPQKLFHGSVIEYNDNCEMLQFNIPISNVCAAYETRSINGCFAGHIVDVLYQQDLAIETWEQFQDRVHSVLVTRRDVVGATLYKDSNCSTAILYATFSTLCSGMGDGNITSLYKTVSRQLSPELITPAAWLAVSQYIFVGGKTHGDTVAFDTTHCVKKCIGARLVKAHLWGGSVSIIVICDFYRRVCQWSAV